MELDEQMLEINLEEEFVNNANIRLSHLKNNDLDAVSAPSEEQTSLVTEEAKKQAAKVDEQVKKISVAPGELGSFQNWGKDVFLRSVHFLKSFPMEQGDI